MRVYLAASAAGLAQALSSGQVAAGPAHAVTSRLRGEQLAIDPGVDDEELELVAMLDAARSSLALLAGSEGSPGSPAAMARRLVLAADVPDASASGTTSDDVAASAIILPPGAVVPFSAVACAFVDEAAAEPAVGAAIAALAAQASGDDPLAALEAVEEHDLLWYDASELAALAAELA